MGNPLGQQALRILNPPVQQAVWISQPNDTRKWAIWTNNPPAIYQAIRNNPLEPQALRIYYPPGYQAIWINPLGTRMCNELWLISEHSGKTRKLYDINRRKELKNEYIITISSWEILATREINEQKSIKKVKNELKKCVGSQSP